MLKDTLHDQPDKALLLWSSIQKSDSCKASVIYHYH